MSTGGSGARLLLLGGFELADAAGAIRLESAKTAALLAYLALRGVPQSRHKLMALLWPELTEERAAANLRRALWDIRRRLTLPDRPVVVLADRSALAFNPHSACSVDAREMLALLAPAERAAPVNLERLEAGVSLYRGDLLDGFHAEGAPDFEEWLLAERERLKALALGALERLAAGHREGGDLGRALAFARRLLALDSWREEGHRTVMQLLAATGQRGAALAQHESLRRILAEELNDVPSEETTQLAERIRASLAAPTPGAGPVVPTRAPTPHNLPLPPTPLVGREAELEEVTRLLRDPACRLLTLLGPGGIGKTRLAVQAALRELVGAAGASDCFVDGIAFVPLAELQAPELLVPAIAAGLGIAFADSTEATDQLLARLADKRLLILLDSFEYVLASAELLSHLLARAPEVRLLVTSRERLRLREEWVLELRGLPLPEERAAAPTEEAASVRLFLQCGHRVRVGFAPDEAELAGVGRICRLVDGMPLAIELAAAWLRSLQPREIADEIERNLDFLTSSLRDVPDRQRSLRAVFEHTWQGLSAAEREAFLPLSVFRQGFSREAAEAVAGVTPPLLLALVDKSLLRREPDGRLYIHEVLRQYARDAYVQEADALDATLRRHCAYFCGLLHRQEGALHGADQRRALAVIGRDVENVRAAWSQAVAMADLDAIDQGIESLAIFHDIRGWFREGFAALGEAAVRLRSLER